jgi:hypothetical protein
MAGAENRNAAVNKYTRAYYILAVLICWLIRLRDH